MKRPDRLKPGGSTVKRRLDAIAQTNQEIHETVKTLLQAQADNAVTPKLLYALLAAVEASLLDQLNALTELRQILVKEQ